VKDSGKKIFLLEEPWPSHSHWAIPSFRYSWILVEECVWAIDWVKYVFWESLCK